MCLWVQNKCYSILLLCSKNKKENESKIFKHCHPYSITDQMVRQDLCLNQLFEPAVALFTANGKPSSVFSLSLETIYAYLVHFSYILRTSTSARCTWRKSLVGQPVVDFSEIKHILENFRGVLEKTKKTPQQPHSSKTNPIAHTTNMIYWLRTLYLMFLAYFFDDYYEKNSKPYDEDHVYEIRVLPYDLDFNLHLNNAQYFSFMEHARFDMILKHGNVFNRCRRAGM